MAYAGSGRLTRRALLGMGGNMALLALAACGAARTGGPAGTSGPASGAPASAPAAASAAAAVGVNASAATATTGRATPQVASTRTVATASIAAPVAGGTRTVVHAMGETRVPASPRRVVVLEEGPLNSALALGITPVGAVTALQGTGYPAYLGERAKGIRSVGVILEPDLEAVATLRPDLILSVKSRHEKIYPQLAQIAPTVFGETLRGSWRPNFLKDAEALGKAAEAERLVGDYRRRLDEFKARMGAARLAETLVSVVRFVPGDTYLYQKESYIGSVLADAGLRRPPSQDVDQFAAKISEEQIQLLDGDVIFVTTYGPGDKTRQQAYQGNPLWQQLKAVRAGKVYAVNDEYWMVGIGILAANRVVDDLSTYLLNA